MSLSKEARPLAKAQKPCVLWFTGLSGAGKTTIAAAVEKRLHALGKHSYLLDGDALRLGLNSDLGFTDADRVENVRRVAELSRLMVDAGLIVLAALISPFEAQRRFARSLFQGGQFVEVFVDTPLEEAERRDTKGLYVRARRGELQHFTGIDSPYEPPKCPEIHLRTMQYSAETAGDIVVDFCRRSHDFL